VPYGSSHRSLGELCRELPQPDCVIFVDVDPATSFARKRGQLSAYEYFSVPHASDYIDFQTRLRELILHRIAGVPVTYRIRGEDDPAQLLARAKSLISSYLSAAQEGARNHGG
jgi:thymidylate kinase